VEQPRQPAPDKGPKWVYFRTNGCYPLFHCRTTKLNGETHEVVLGPCFASLVKWLIFGLGFAMMRGGASATDVFAFIKMLHLF
jgi:hypothetical protein